MVKHTENDDWLKDAFKSEPIADDGFSNLVMRRVQGQVLIRRWTMPIAMLIGGVIAAKPAAELIIFASRFIEILPTQVSALPMTWLPHGTTFAIAAVLILIGSGFAQALQD